MTTTEPAILAAAPIHQIVDVDGIPMSALMIEAQNPRAVILAIHGGATSSAYYDCPGHPRSSLMRTAAALGFTVLALDRPGYGSSLPYADQLTSAQARVDIAYAALDLHLGSRPRGVGVFIWGHSIGCELATRLAADDRGDALLGIELSGTGLEQQPAAKAVLGTMATNADPKAVRELLWQPSRIYPPELVGGGPIASRGPSFEGAVVRAWPHQDFPALAPRVKIPLHFTAAEFENVWRGDPEALNDIAAMFTAAPRVVLKEQFDSGHNLSLGNTAMAYHLEVLSFFEECIESRSRALAAQEVGK